MTNPIPKNDFWATPESFEELTEMLESIGSANEKRMAWFGAMLALNLCHDFLEKHQDRVA
jgi:hypothetical protein